MGGAQFGFEFLDPLAALFVGILVGKIGFQLLTKNLHGLMDAPLHANEIDRIRRVAVAVDGVRGVDNLRTRGMGRGYLADLRITVDPHATVERSNTIAGEVRDAIRREIEHLKDITIVCDPHVEE